METKFKKGDKVIYDSGKGYEIGYFNTETISYDIIDIATGILSDAVPFHKNKILKYSNQLIDELTKKYGYEKRFSDVF